MVLEQQNIVFLNVIFSQVEIWHVMRHSWNITSVIHFGVLHFKNAETLFYFVGPIQGWIGYAGTHVPMFVHKLGLIKPRQTALF